MAPLNFLLFTFLVFALSLCAAEVLDLKRGARNNDAGAGSGSGPASGSALSTRARPRKQPSLDDYHFLPPVGASASRALSNSPFSDSNLGESHEKELLDIVLLASVDGRLHALNRTTGHTIWSMASSSSSASTSSTSSTPPSHSSRSRSSHAGIKVEAPSSGVFGPLVQTSHIADFDPDLADPDDFAQEQYIIEPQSGDIYILNNPTGSLQRLPFSMAQLVDMSPFVFGESEDDRRVFVGTKHSSLVLLELETGKVKGTVDSECPWEPFQRPSAQRENAFDLDLDELEGSATQDEAKAGTEVFIGRTKYTISIHHTSRRRSLAPVQTLSFSVYGPNNQDLTAQANYLRSADDNYIQPLPTGEIVSLHARSSTNPENNKKQWMREFSQPIVAVFDVLRSPSRPHPFLLLQPTPRLPDVLDRDKLTVASRAGALDAESAYVGLIPESGSLFAMSPERFPLVVFAPPRARAADQTQYETRGREGEEDEEPELPEDIESVTRRRRLREMCHGGSMDPRCLTGVRKLEHSAESRLSRLLDPPLPDPPPPAERHDVDAEPDIGIGTGGIPPLVHNASTTGMAAAAGALLGMDGSGPTAATVFTILSLVFSFACLWYARSKASAMAKASVPVLAPATATPEVSISSLQVSQPAVPSDSLESATLAPPASDSTPSSSPPHTPKTVPAELAPAVAIASGSEPNGSAARPSTREADVKGDGEESEPENEVGGVAGKRKPARRKRGKKGKKDKGSAGGDANGDVDGDEDGIETPVANTAPSISVVPPTPRAAQTASLEVSDTILGFGSHGTVVFRGTWQGRAVAVKRLLQDFVTLASREVSILQDSDDHPNVIRYFCQEAHSNFLYIALELCPASLADVVERPDMHRSISNSFDPKRALRQITSGLRHLHALKIVHRDIKPQNILVSAAKPGAGPNAGHRMMISDFGLCRRLEVDQTSFLPTAHGAAVGTVGWRAPEILRGEVTLDEQTGDDASQSSRGSVGTVHSAGGSSASKPTRLTKSVDIFALGCLFYYVLTNGGHPYGDRFERDVNIVKDVKTLAGLERFGEEGAEAVHLITSMLDADPPKRPDTTQCLVHPFFWDPERRLNFLQDASDRFEIMCRDPKDPLLIRLEKEAFSVVGHDWHSRLDRVFIENLGKFRKYDGKSVQDLLRAFRNKKHHYQDLPDNVKRVLGPMPEGFLGYFTKRFPRLFMHVHGVISGSILRQESMFRNFFELAD